MDIEESRLHEMSLIQSDRSCSHHEDHEGASGEVVQQSHDGHKHRRNNEEYDETRDQQNDRQQYGEQSSQSTLSPEINCLSGVKKRPVEMS